MVLLLHVFMHLLKSIPESTTRPHTLLNTHSLKHTHTHARTHTQAATPCVGGLYVAGDVVDGTSSTREPLPPQLIFTGGHHVMSKLHWMRVLWWC